LEINGCASESLKVSGEMRIRASHGLLWFGLLSLVNEVFTLVSQLPWEHQPCLKMGRLNEEAIAWIAMPSVPSLVRKDCKQDLCQINSYSLHNYFLRRERVVPRCSEWTVQRTRRRRAETFRRFAKPKNGEESDDIDGWLDRFANEDEEVSFQKASRQSLHPY
jgi:hypothetical protein